MNEHECVILATDLPDHRLRAGDLGAIIHVHENHAAYEVEFVTLDGQTIAVVTLLPNQIKPITKHQVANVRDLATA